MSSTPTTSGDDADSKPDSTEPEGTQTERWIYGGMRLSIKDKKLGVWIDPDGTELLYPHKAGRIVGCWYEVQVRLSRTVSASRDTASPSSSDSAMTEN